MLPYLPSISLHHFYWYSKILDPREFTELLEFCDQRVRSIYRSVCIILGIIHQSRTVLSGMSADSPYVETNRMQQVSHIERVDSAPSTPTRGHGLEFRSPATPSRKRFTFSTWTSPLKSLRSRRKFTVSTNQGPTVKKHNPSLFSFFYGTRTRSLGSTDALKDGVGPHRPKTASPSKNHLRGGRS